MYILKIIHGSMLGQVFVKRFLFYFFEAKDNLSWAMYLERYFYCLKGEERMFRSNQKKHNLLEITQGTV